MVTPSCAVCHKGLAVRVQHCVRVAGSGKDHPDQPSKRGLDYCSKRTQRFTSICACSCRKQLHSWVCPHAGLGRSNLHSMAHHVVRGTKLHLCTPSVRRQIFDEQL
jgi:hypothetical protein